MYKKNINIVEREIHGTFFLINIKDNYLDEKCRLFEVNEIGKFIWQNIEAAAEISDITRLLMSNIIDEVSYDEIYDDVSSYIDILIEQKFLEES